ncbi:hypothetical protein DSL72_001508 [Monilinia vaccinii-corymbosi]|uniref:Nicotinamide-nucleotide adenylyltransferase n=1 Tax=Monilinia vaccinii-corymbosi TaxID=61207 RepID=A0A8A3PA56_9HELO|nr:hypothetical protein DSL72_001508 [Monilinia vaccinii-corymbosi]
MTTSNVSCLNFYTKSLQSFISSPSNFRILRSISPRTPTPRPPPKPLNLTSLGLNSHEGYYLKRSYDPSTDALEDDSPTPQSLPQTLYILDSSFNPPTLGHAHICLSALRDHYSSSELRQTKARLLLLLSTQNADKKITGATLEERLVGMECFATDVLKGLTHPHSDYHYTQTMRTESRASATSESTSRPDAENESGDEEPSSSDVESECENHATSTTSTPPNPSNLGPEIEIGLTSLPYFHEKSAAIESSAIYPPGTTQVHCIGYDTLVRVLNTKYYLRTRDLSPLIPFLQRHKLRVTYRNTDNGSYTAEDQRKYLSDMSLELPRLGGLSSWITEKRIYMVEGLDGSEISSSKVRAMIGCLSVGNPHAKGAGSRKIRGKGLRKEKLIKQKLKGMVGGGVAKWIMGEKLYYIPKTTSTTIRL